MMLTKHDYIKRQFADREQRRWNLSNPDDAATLLMELMELEWRCHHLSLLKYRNHKYKEFHDYFGQYWACKSIISVLFPWHNSHDTFSRVIRELNREMDSEEAETNARMMQR